MMEAGELLLFYRDNDRLQEFDNSTDCRIFYIEDTTKAEFDDYISKITDVIGEWYGFTQIRDNWFYTFVYGKIELHAYYTEHDHTARIIVDGNTALYCNRKEAGGGQEKSINVYQFEVDYTRIDCGMCYIIELDRGIFFLIDSAHMFSENDHHRIYQFLRERTEEGRPVKIAGWFLTHGHQDHIVKFMDFVSEGFQDVELENIYYNFPKVTVPGSEKWKPDDIKTMCEFEELMKRHKELKTVRLHTGQQFYIGPLKCTVLLTHEDLCGMSLDCYNDSSAVMLVENGEGRMVFLGDSNVFSSSELIARYGSFIRSDIVQVAHHGFNGSNVGIYYYLKPKAALYATGRYDFEQVKDSDANKAVLKICEEYYVAGNGTVKLSLPYKKESTVVLPKEILETVRR